MTDNNKQNKKTVAAPTAIHRSFPITIRCRRDVNCDRSLGIVKRAALVLTVCFIAIAILITALPVSNDVSDAATTDSLTYTLSGDVLTISGTGDMKDYASYYNLRNIYTFTSCVIESGVTSVGEYAFYNCISLTTVTIPDTMIIFGNGAFQKCTSLTSVTIPDNVTTIGGYAFSGCTSLTSVTIPDNVTTIGISAFSGCTSLTSVTIPDNVTTIGSSAFSGCTSLISIIVNSSNLNYSSLDGVLFDIDKTTLMQYPVGKTATSYNIPDTVTTIADSAFKNCVSLESIEIPDGLITIGNNVFEGCTSLKSLIIPNTVTDIGFSAFSHCSSLASVTLSSGLTDVGDSLFSDCTSLDSIIIPYGVERIGVYTFNGCTNLSSITISNSVTTLADYAFGYCTALTSITIPDSVTSIGQYAFGNCTALTSITMPDIMTIAENAFRNCSMTDVCVTLPTGSVTTDGVIERYFDTSSTSWVLPGQSNTVSTLILATNVGVVPTTDIYGNSGLKLIYAEGYSYEYYGTWMNLAPGQVVVVYDCNGGFSADSFTYVAIGGTIASFPTAYLTDYDLIGWYTAATGGTQITASTAFPWNDIVYAQWGQGITATFVGNYTGTTYSENVPETYDSAYVLPLTDPIRAGYTFTGWYTLASGGTQITTADTVNITAATTFYAQWTPVISTATFVGNYTGTTYSENVPETYDSAYVLPLTDPIRAGYVFSGWYTSAIGGTQITTVDTVNITAATTFYAQWTANTCSVTIGGNGGSATSVIATYDSALSVFTASVRTGYALTGYWTAVSGGTMVIMASGILVSDISPYSDASGYWIDDVASVDLYAQWTPVISTATFVGNYTGTTYSENVPETYDSAYVLPATTPTRAGYTFTGWYTLASGGTQITTADTVNITAATTFYAQWTPVISTATFVGNYTGTTYSENVPETYDSAYVLPLTDPIRAGYVFSGWYTSAIGGTQITTVDTVNITAATTFYAHWTANTCAVTLNGNGGSFASVTATYGSVLPAFTASTWAGYALTGYWTAVSGGTMVIMASGILVSDISPYSDASGYWIDDVASVILYAQWAQAVTATFTGNYTGTSYSEAVVEAQGSTYVLPLTDPIRAGYTFTGWYTLASGGTQITTADTVNITAATTFYAQWTPVISTATFVGNYTGTTYSENVPETYDSAYVLPLTDPIRAGYVFSGWYTLAIGGTQITTADTVNITVPTTFYAHWIPVISTATFVGNYAGTSYSENVPETYDSAYVLPATTPTRAGYTFTGWYTLASGGTQITTADTVNITAATTFYAQWTPVISTATFVGNYTGTTYSENVPETYDSAYVLPLTDPIRAGYVFSGWYTLAIGGTQITTADTVNITAATTFYAHWAQAVTATFTGNYTGTSYSEAITEAQGSTYVLPATTPTRAGYTFTGWYTSETGGSQITSSTTVIITTATTFYAQWTEASTASNYTVSFSSGPGYTVSCSTSTTVSSGESLIFTVSVSSGYILNSVTATEGTLSHYSAGYILSNITADSYVNITVSVQQTAPDPPAGTDSEDNSSNNVIAIVASAIVLCLVAALALFYRKS